MILYIDDTRRISDLQEKFSECFPNLKIEFYAHPHHWKEASLQIDAVDPSKKIGEVRKNHEHGGLEIKSWYQAGKVEQDLKNLFGLNAQIFRNENGQWRQTVSSDNLTLTEQQEITSASTEGLIKS